MYFRRVVIIVLEGAEIHALCGLSTRTRHVIQEGGNIVSWRGLKFMPCVAQLRRVVIIVTWRGLKFIIMPCAAQLRVRDKAFQEGGNIVS